MEDIFYFGYVTDKDLAEMADNVIKYEDELKRLEESSKNTKEFLDNLGKSDKNINGLKEELKDGESPYRISCPGIIA